MADNYPRELKDIKEIKPFKSMKSTHFLWEYCWVVYASGFKESILEQKFGDIEKAFRYFDIKRVSNMKSINPVYKVFQNRVKANNFIRGVRLIHQEGFSNFKKRILKNGMEALQELPGIGEITKKHLARNIGLSDIAKNDVHIQRLIKYFNAKDENDLVGYLSEEFNEKKGVADVILWRFCANKGWKEYGHYSLRSYIESL